MALSPGLQKALRWPAFIYSVMVLYWSAAVVGLLYKIKWLQLSKAQKRNDILGWYALTCDISLEVMIHVVHGGQAGIPAGGSCTALIAWCPC